jgi:hypothetical protein
MVQAARAHFALAFISTLLLLVLVFKYKGNVCLGLVNGMNQCFLYEDQEIKKRVRFG